MSERSVYDEDSLRGLFNRFLQILALYAPGGKSIRARLHRMRGVRMDKNVWVGTAAILETGHPYLVSIGSGSVIGIRSVIIAHFREMGVGKREADAPTVIIEENVFIGPGVIILPNVRIGKGSVVTAGSVVTTSVPPMTLVQGNPAKPIAKCGVPLAGGTSYKEFLRHLMPIRPAGQEK